MNLIKNLLPKNKYKDPVKNSNCTELEVDKKVISEFVLGKLLPIVGYHPFPLDELMLMTIATTYFKPDIIFEWGTHIGKAARTFYEIKKAFNLKTKIHSIDLPDEVDHIEHPHNRRGVLVKNIEEVKLHQGDGLDTSIEIYSHLTAHNPQPSALFFIDGDHEYSSVKREIAGIVKNVESPIMLLHDTFYQSKPSDYNIGPYKAVQEFLDSEQGKRFTVISTNAGLPGMTLLFEKK